MIYLGEVPSDRKARLAVVGAADFIMPESEAKPKGRLDYVKIDGRVCYRRPEAA